ncbi:Gfo/Idh/MocA family oxidoreductase [uncultured Aquimarina sp.]|uniref:Gfo/Idh/MocA family protein n=1 Tax=uncultured Aquimarina sp. TaxID=575652 RepID=UPI0026377A87|nr:Gfo/Idh/MocA family oxidoreductase [uncultured Aquimarina sp.]
MGRLRYNNIIKIPITVFKKNKKNIAVVGCGQFAFATIGFFLRNKLGRCFYGVYDIDKANATSLANYYGGMVFEDANELITNPNVEVLYVASNHFTHTEYAIKGLEAGKTVYLEKPISVNHEQFSKLIKSYNVNQNKLFVGYNRPFSPSVKTILSYLNNDKRTPLTLNCFISGHKIPEDNWYRNPEEGTRVCGNVGHWIDLAIHFLYKVGLPKRLQVSIQASSSEEVDDNLTITFISEIGDLITIVLTSRTEPFEGINETINFQHGEVIAKIDDFRRMTLWKSDELIKERYFRKDVGHKNAIYQPFNNENTRDFNEVKISTLLMLDIKEAVLKNKKEFIFTINETDHTRP